MTKVYEKKLKIMPTTTPQQTTDSATVGWGSSHVSLTASYEEDTNSSLSEDEDFHRTYRATRETLHSTPVQDRQKSKFYEGSFLSRLMQIGKKRVKEFQDKQIQSPVFDSDSAGSNKKTENEESSHREKKNIVLKENIGDSKADEVRTCSKLNGMHNIYSQHKSEETSTNNKNGRSRLSQDQEPETDLFAQSNGFSDTSQRSMKPNRNGSRVFASGVSAEPGGRRKVKVILVGDSGVGKSTFLQTLARGEFVPSSKMSNILSAQTNLVLTHSCQKVELEIQDTAGQERFRSLTASYYRHAHGCLVFFNVNDKDSFESVKNWLDDIQMYHSSTLTPAVVLVGLLHHPPRDRNSFRRRSSLRGDDIKAFNSYSSSPKDNNNLSGNHSGGGSRRGSAHDVHKHQLHQNEQDHHHHHSHDNHHQPQPHLLTVPTIMIEPSNDDDDILREVPRAQAEHMAAHWEIPYVEVDSRFDNDSVLKAIETLLDLVVPDLAEIARSRLNSIVPASSRRSSLNWSNSSMETFNNLTCCLHC